MSPATLPSNESARLTALRACRVLDTEPELAFDDLTALAAELCGAPIALISLVDEQRQWFKSRHGFDLAETPRELAFCAHAILQAEALVVPDARADLRFRDNPLVTATPGIRAYAGMPLVDRDGMALGTLCVIDHEPRHFTARMLLQLERLGRQAMAQLELRRSRDAAVRSLAAKADFLSGLSREIRTPLSGILGISQLLLDTQLDADQRSMLEAARDSGHQLLTILNDRLDGSQRQALNAVWAAAKSAPADASTYGAAREPLRVVDPPAAPLVGPRDTGLRFDGLRVLVAEDNTVNRMVAKRVLESLGCSVTVAETGAAAVAAWHGASFDVVLMDCRMPEMDGFEATCRIRAIGGAASRVPIIALTASTLDEDRERCMTAGMTDFLSKPVSPAQLAGALGRALAAH